MAEVIGVIEEIVFRNEDNGFTVLILLMKLMALWVIRQYTLCCEGSAVRIIGEWSVHPDYGAD